jgi:predicted dithiol-disulfide oxidoreductase (DUF899 family)
MYVIDCPGGLLRWFNRSRRHPGGPNPGAYRQSGEPTTIRKEGDPSVNTNLIAQPKVVSRAEWLSARKQLLAGEKLLTHQRDEIDRQRRELPWVKVEKDYLFDGPGGRESLADLFAGRSQLIVSHFMFGPGWKEGCVGCSFRSDHIEGARTHLEHHDVSLVTISRAPLPEIQAFKERMGWRFKWLSSYSSDFNYDYGVSFTKEEVASGKVNYNYQLRDFVVEELSGISVFHKNAEDEIFHTYSTYARGDEMLATTYMYLDLTPKGRNENGPHFSLGDWVRHHDRYDATGFVNAGGRFVASPTQEPSCKCEGESDGVGR